MTLSQIETLCTDHFFHNIRNEITYRLAVSDAFSNKGSGNVHHGCINEFNVRMRPEPGKLRGGARINVKSVVFQDPFMILPFYKVDEVVFANDDFKCFVRMSFTQVHQCMDSIAGFGKMKFDIRRLDFVVVIGSGAHHIKAIEFMEQSLARFERIMGRNNHPYLTQVRGFRHNIGDDQVTDVDGVKRTEEETYFQGVRISNFKRLSRLFILEVVVQTLCFRKRFVQVLVYQYNVEFVAEAHFKFGFE